MSTPTPTRRGFARVGALAVRRRVPILVLAVLFVVVSAVLGGGVVSRLSSGGFDDPGSDSSTAAAALADRFDAGPSDVVLVVGSTGGASVDSPAVAAAATALAEKLAKEPGVRDVSSYWATKAPAMRSTDGTLALVTARLTESGDAAQTRAGQLAEELAGPTPDGVLDVHVSGAPVVFHEAPTAGAAPIPQAAAAAAQPALHLIASPIVGTFYSSPSPTAEPFVRVGDRVRKGQVLCIVEAMKLMNEIECDVDGIVAEIHPRNAQPVEFGEPLFGIRPE